jgi:hypothetical protein
MPDKTATETDDILLWWGIVGWLVQFFTSYTYSGAGGWGGYNSISWNGWRLMTFFSYTLWGPNLLFWLIRFFVQDNEMVNWLFVLTGNLTMLGPIFGYWLSALLILVGWIVSAGDGVGVGGVISFTFYLMLAFILSFYQVAWIDTVRGVYSGDMNTLTDNINSIDTSIDDKASRLL